MSRGIQADFCSLGAFENWARHRSRTSSGISIGKKGFVTTARGRECHGSQRKEGDGASDPDFFLIEEVRIARRNDENRLGKIERRRVHTARRKGHCAKSRLSWILKEGGLSEGCGKKTEERPVKGRGTRMGWGEKETQKKPARWSKSKWL